MSGSIEDKHSRESFPLVPRFSKQGFTTNEIKMRREWLQNLAATELGQVGAYSLDSESMRGNIENAIGTVQVPLGVAGPLKIEGEHAHGTFYVPLATTEGALVRSYERGMMAVTRSGGVHVRVSSEGNRACPIFSFECVESSHRFCSQLKDHFCSIKEIAESTTKHGRLVHIHARQIGRDAVVDFQYDTADAHGMNMVSKATDAVCSWLIEQFDIVKYYVLTGGSSEKRASAALFQGGKGKHVTAGLCLPANIVRSYLKTTPKNIFHMWQRTLLAQIQAGVLGFNGHYANGLAAIFIACGQDVANVTNSAVGITNFDVMENGDLYASVTLPSLTVGTIGGGTGLGTGRECLNLLDCYGAGKATKFAEIIAATILAGELSFGAALASGGFVEAHETYGRNRPPIALS